MYAKMMDMPIYDIYAFFNVSKMTRYIDLIWA